MFNEYFEYQNPLLLAKDLIKTDQSNSKQIAKQTINSINKLKNYAIKKQILKNENPNKLVNIVEKILEFKNQ